MTCEHICARTHIHIQQYFTISVSFNSFVQKYIESSEVYFWLTSTLKSVGHCWWNTHTHTYPRLGNTFVIKDTPDDAKWHAALCFSVVWQQPETSALTHCGWTIKSGLFLHEKKKRKSSAHFLYNMLLPWIIIYIKLVAIEAKPLLCLLFDSGNTIKAKSSEIIT